MTWVESAARNFPCGIALTAMAIHLGEKNVPSAVDERLKVGKKKIAG